MVGCRRQIDKTKLKPGTRVALDMTTLTIMRYLPREVDPLVYNMSCEDPGDINYSSIGGLSEQIRELREVRIEIMPIGTFLKYIQRNIGKAFGIGKVLSVWFQRLSISNIDLVNV